jgi:HEAT repeat protein
MLAAIGVGVLRRFSPVRRSEKAMFASLTIWWTARQLQSGDPRRRRQAAERLGQVHHPRAAAHLAAALTEPDFWVRQSIVEGLQQQGDAAVPALREVLLRGAPARAMQAAEVLGSLGVPAAADALLGAEKHPDRSVREAALLALQRLGRLSVAALGVLVNKGDRDSAIKAAELLGQTGAPEAAEPLVMGLKFAEHSVRVAAVRALEQLGAAAAPTLRGVLDDPYPYVRNEARRLLERLGEAVPARTDAE